MCVRGSRQNHPEISEGQPSLFFVQNYQLTFGGPGASVPGQNFHYTMAPAICQEENAIKMHKLFLPILYTLPIAICFWMCYNTLVSEGQITTQDRASRAKKKVEKTS